MKTVPLETTDFLFITGVEGSGTTMMLKLLDSLPDIAVLGGNYWTPELASEASHFNALTEQLWNRKAPPNDIEREEIFQDIRHFPVPGNARLVVHKRSCPFLDPFHLPDLSDVARFTPHARLLVMRRDPDANTRSILRRGFEKEKERATARTGMALQALDTQLKDNPVPTMQIYYEEIISPEKKAAILRNLAGFLGLDPMSLAAKADMITGPTPSGKA